MKRPARRTNVKAIETPPPGATLAERARFYRQAPSPEEIARRQAAWAEILKAQTEMPPMEEDVTELLRRAREEEDARLDG